MNPQGLLKNTTLSLTTANTLVRICLNCVHTFRSHVLNYGLKRVRVTIEVLLHIRTQSLKSTTLMSEKSSSNEK